MVMHEFYDRELNLPIYNTKHIHKRLNLARDVSLGFLGFIGMEMIIFGGIYAFSGGDYRAAAIGSQIPTLGFGLALFETFHK